jgi:transcriptional antiterminator RfaH
MPARRLEREPGENSLAAAPFSPTRPRPAWYCLRSQPRHEHIAASHLAYGADFEVYLPRIRVPRPTRSGPVWRTEALFPNYLFARFELGQAARRVQYTRGVSGIVHFGDHWPSIPDSVIAELRAAETASRDRALPRNGGAGRAMLSDASAVSLRPGEPVVISGGALHSFSATVLRVMPAHARVAVLLDFLGRPSAVELDAAAVLRPEHERRRLVGLSPLIS